MEFILGAVVLSFLLGLTIITSYNFKVNPGKFSEDNGLIVTIPTAILSGGTVACLMWYFLH